LKKGYWRVKNLMFENYARRWEKIIDEAIGVIKRNRGQSSTVMKSLSCGALVASFNIGGIPDMISSK